MNLKELEARLQTLIEVGLVSVSPGRKMEDVVIQKLAVAIETNIVTQEDGVLIAPNVFTLIVHPDSVDQWQDQRLLETILQSLYTVSQEAGLRFASAPTITITTDDSLALNDANVMASQRIEPMADTKATPMDTENLGEKDKLPENAFLIIEGVKVFPLSQPVINIGRRLDNQLVIDDPRVSRNHAQLRVIKGRFVVFDLNSTGGTFVNGQRTSQSVLYPGDVISLAGVALIFGQDNPLPCPGLKDTSPLPNAAGERPTAIIKDHFTTKFRKK